MGIGSGEETGLTVAIDASRIILHRDVAVLYNLKNVLEHVKGQVTSKPSEYLY